MTREQFEKAKNILHDISAIKNFKMIISDESFLVSYFGTQVFEHDLYRELDAELKKTAIKYTDKCIHALEDELKKL